EAVEEARVVPEEVPVEATQHLELDLLQEEGGQFARQRGPGCRVGPRGRPDGRGPRRGSWPPSARAAPAAGFAAGGRASSLTANCATTVHHPRAGRDLPARLGGFGAGGPGYAAPAERSHGAP